jgi:hypothetical protein
MRVVTRQRDECYHSKGETDSQKQATMGCGLRQNGNASAGSKLNLEADN